MDEVTGGPAVWRTDDPCPVCATGLFLTGHGQIVQVLECRACGWSETWDLTDDEPDGNGGDAR